MKLIETKTLATSQAGIAFENIPQDGTDLFAVYSIRTEAAGPVVNLGISVNGSTSNITNITLGGQGSTSYRQPSTSGTLITSGSSTTSNTFGNGSIYIKNYVGSTNKSMLIDNVMENNSSQSWLEATSTLWSSTSPITSLGFGIGTTLLAGSTVSLYRIIKGSDGITTVS
jgi:hypothetical protein